MTGNDIAERQCHPWLAAPGWLIARSSEREDPVRYQCSFHL
jgi:hypothetical protein